jgi:predicted protein tyrosine phosphatase
MLTAINVAYDNAESIICLPDDTCLISIGNEHEAFWQLKVDGPRVLRQVFSDITSDQERHNLRWKALPWDQACEIAEFINQHQDKKFVVNCHAGISRSAAVCLFIHKTYGHQLAPNFWALSQPNPYVFGTLTLAHELHIKKMGHLFREEH